MSNDSQRSARDVLQLAASVAAMPVLALASAPILARALGPDGRGEMAAIVALSLFLSSLGSFGLPDAASFFVAKTYAIRRVMRSAIGVLLASSLVIVIIGWFLAPVMLDSSPEATRVAQLVVLLSPLFLLQNTFRSTL